MLEVFTNNRNRTVADIRHIFSRHGGNLGESGCVAWMFSRKGYITVNKEDLSMDEDELFMIALEAGAEDVKNEGDSYGIITGTEQFEAVKSYLEEQKIKIAGAEVPCCRKQP